MQEHELINVPLSHLQVPGQFCGSQFASLHDDRVLRRLQSPTALRMYVVLPDV
jgi:hypothetical protein